MEYLVEIIVCEHDEDGERWRADGRMVAKLPTRAAAERIAEILVMEAKLNREGRFGNTTL